MMKSILVDIDHTVSDAFWRDPMIGVSSWDDYHAYADKDKPLHDVVELLRRLHGHYNIVGFTARPEKWRQLTMKWCVKYQVPFDEILMRSYDNYQHSPVLKRELIEKRFPDLNEIAFALEDREDVCVMLKGIGITTLQVHARRVM